MSTRGTNGQKVRVSIPGLVNESLACLQLEEAFANQKKHEKQIQVEEERRREKERLEELKKREQERILEVSLDFFNFWCV